MRLILCCSLWLISIVSVSQTLNEWGKDTVKNHNVILNEVTINAPVNIVSLKSWPGSISSIDSMQLNAGNSYQLVQQLNSLPGVMMQQGTLSTNRITIRGIGSRTPYNSNRIKAYWGEIPLTDGDGVTSIEDIGFNDIYSVQVLKGPSSALYGAGLGGVILINPWTPVSNKQQFKFQSEAGSYATFSNQLSTTLRHSKGSTFISANQLSTDGYRDNSQYKRYNFTLKGKHILGKNNLNYLYNFRYLDGQIPSSLDSIDFHNNPRKAADSWAAIGGYEKSNRHILNLGLVTQLTPVLYHSVNTFGIFSVLDELRPFNRLDESKTAIGLRDKLSIELNSFRLESGLEFMFENNEITLSGVKEHNLNDILSENDIRRNYLNIFTLAEYSIENKLLIQGAINFNWTNYDSKQQSTGKTVEHQYPMIVSPRLGINYQLTHQSHIYAAAGHGFSAPSVEEAQMPDGSFNASIKPEEGYHFDIGYRYNSKDRNTNIDLTAYWMLMTNLLVTKRESEEIFYGANAGKTKHKGIELQINHRIRFSNNHQLFLNGSHTQSINKFDDFIDDGEDYKNNHLPGIPGFSTYLSVNYSADKTSLIINYQHWGKQYLTDSNDKQYSAFGVLNAKLNQQVNFRYVKGNIYFGANNIMDKYYASMILINAPSFGNNQPRYYYPALPFHVYGGISLSL